MFDFFVGCFLISVIIFLAFIIGCIFMRRLIREEEEQARHEEMRREYYRLAGVRTPTDPKPYVPPYNPPRRTNRMLPGLDRLGVLIRDGKRGTLMWRAGDRNKNAG